MRQDSELPQRGWLKGLKRFLRENYRKSHFPSDTYWHETSPFLLQAGEADGKLMYKQCHKV